MSIRNVTYSRIETTTLGGGGYGNSFNFKVTREIEVGPKGSNNWVSQSVLAHGERDVANSFEWANQQVPIELCGRYDGYGRNAF